MFSDLPFRWKLTALAMFAAIMAGVGWFATNLFHNWLPETEAAMLGIALAFCALGTVIGMWIARRDVAREIGYDPLAKYHPPIQWKRLARFAVGYVVAGLVLIALVSVLWG